jgi:hypothetical protein
MDKDKYKKMEIDLSENIYNHLDKTYKSMMSKDDLEYPLAKKILRELSRNYAHGAIEVIKAREPDLTEIPLDIKTLICEATTAGLRCHSHNSGNFNV